MPDKYSDPSDRRAELRRPASGNVKIRPNGLPAISIRHSHQPLGSGHIVEFAYGSVKGRARVVWTRILSDHVESGFLILPPAMR